MVSLSEFWFAVRIHVKEHRLYPDQGPSGLIYRAWSFGVLTMRFGLLLGQRINRRLQLPATLLAPYVTCDTGNMAGLEVPCPARSDTGLKADGGVDPSLDNSRSSDGPRVNRIHLDATVEVQSHPVRTANMATETLSAEEPQTTELRLSSGNGPITRTILKTPLRDALPSEIPIIDISAIFSTSITDRRAAAAQIRDAAMNNGFFYIANHGVASSVTDTLHAACLDFFRQDMATKRRADSSQSAYFNGYKAPRSQRINPHEGVDVRETFSWTYDPRYDPDVPDPEAIPAEARRFMRPEDFPWEATRHMPHFRDAAVAYFRECLRVARALTRVFALSLDLDEEFFVEKVQYPDAAFALNYYPPLETPRQGDEQVSIGSHTDFQLFTILWQDTQGGLQVLSRNGQWLRAAPREGTFVVNIGDYLQRVTNGRYLSTVHRARNTSGRERVSMPFFWGFGLHESCGVVESCVGEDGRLYEEVSCEEWVHRRVREMLKVEGDKKG